MAQFFTNFDEQPVGDVTTSGQTDWTPKISNGSSDYRILDGGDADGKFLRITAVGTNGSRVLAYNPLNGENNVETLVKFRPFKSGSDGSIGRFGAAYTRYGGTTEAGTIGYSVSLTPVSNVKSVVLDEDSTGVVQYAAFAWTMNTEYFVRTRVQGNDRYVKIWDASSSEPGSWTFSSNATPPTIASPYSGVGTYQADSYLYVTQFSAGTNGDSAPMTLNEIVPSSTPVVGYSGGFGGPFSGFGTAIGQAKQNTVLSVDNATHDHIATSITVTQSHTLVVSNAAHTHVATSPVLTQVHKLTVANASHAHAATSPVLAINHNLVVQNAVHTLTSDNLTLVTGFAAVPDNTVHNLTSDNITLIQHQILAIDNAVHAHIATSPTIVEAKTLSIANATHALTDSIGPLSITHYLSVANTVHDLASTSPTPVQAAILAVNNATHLLTSTTIDIVQFTLLNKPDDAVHNLTSSSPSLSQKHILAIDDAIHRLKSDIIQKIINWTELGVDYGLYRRDNTEGGLLVEIQLGNPGIYRPEAKDQGQLNAVEPETPGLYKRNNYETGYY